MSVEQLQEATKRKLKGLFFIKSKHAHPTFKNHQYFEMPHKTKIDLSNQDASPLSATHSLQMANKWKMFVEGPSSFGIENTYQYMCNRIKLDRRNRIKHLSNPKSNPTEIKLPKKNISRKMHTCEAETERLDMTTIQTSYGKRENLYGKRETQPSHKYLQTTQSFNYRIRKQLPPPVPSPPSPLPSSQASAYPAQHIISLSYIPSRLYHTPEGQLPNLQINIIPYICSCFRKCKISYQKLNQQEYEQISSHIQQIKSSTSSPFDIKDIINLDTISQVFSILATYPYGAPQWVEVVRYFFMPLQDVLFYQFNRFVDQVRVLSVMKFNVEIVGDQVFIFRVEDKTRVRNIYDLLKPGTYIYSQSKTCFDTYSEIIRQRAQAYSYKNRVKKWRSVAPLDEANTSCKSPSLVQEEPEQQGMRITKRGNKHTIEKYERLFQLTKQRRKKYSSIKASSTGHGILITASSIGSSQFIDRSKFHKTDDIFE